MSRLSACLLSLVVTAAAAAEPTLERTLVGRPFAAEYRVDDLALSGDGEVVLGAVGGRVAVWEASSGRRLGELPAGEHVDALATAGALLITAQDAAARVRERMESAGVEHVTIELTTSRRDDGSAAQPPLSCPS